MGKETEYLPSHANLLISRHRMSDSHRTLTTSGCSLPSENGAKKNTVDVFEVEDAQGVATVTQEPAQSAVRGVAIIPRSQHVAKPETPT